MKAYKLLQITTILYTNRSQHSMTLRHVLPAAAIKNRYDSKRKRKPMLIKDS